MVKHRASTDQEHPTSTTAPLGLACNTPNPAESKHLRLKAVHLNHPRIVPKCQACSIEPCYHPLSHKRTTPLNPLTLNFGPYAPNPASSLGVGLSHHHEVRVAGQRLTQVEVSGPKPLHVASWDLVSRLIMEKETETSIYVCLYIYMYNI